MIKWTDAALISTKKEAAVSFLLSHLFALQAFIQTTDHKHIVEQSRSVVAQLFFTQPFWTPDTLAALASKLKSNFSTFKAVIPSFLFIKQRTLTTFQCYNGICKRNHAPMFETIDEDKDNSWSLSNSSHFKPDALHLRLFTAAYGFKGCPVRLLYSLSSFFFRVCL